MGTDPGDVARPVNATDDAVISDGFLFTLLTRIDQPVRDLFSAVHWDTEDGSYYISEDNEDEYVVRGELPAGELIRYSFSKDSRTVRLVHKGTAVRGTGEEADDVTVSAVIHCPQ